MVIFLAFPPISKPHRQDVIFFLIKRLAIGTNDGKS